MQKLSPKQKEELWFYIMFAFMVVLFYSLVFIALKNDAENKPVEHSNYILTPEYPKAR